MTNNSEKEVREELQEIFEAVQDHEPDPKRVRRRGPAREWERAQQKAANKQQITARFDADVIEQYKELAGEGSYQRLMNQALREWLSAQQTEEMVRRVIREELAVLNSSS